MPRKKVKVLIVTLSVAFTVICFSPLAGGNQQQVLSSSCVDCHATHRSGVPALYAKSTHASAAITCVSCHQGDQSATDRKTAHGKNLIGIPTPVESIRMCGSCHDREHGSFNAGKHARDRLGNPRVDCTQCHGAHSVGARSLSFNMAYFCSGCHGLEYLPETPRSLQELLNRWDDIRIATNGLKDTGRSLPESLERKRKDIRRLIADIVHPTDMRGGLERIWAIVSSSDDLKKMIEREKSK